MRDIYFVISQFDTDANVDVYDKEGLLEELKEWRDSEEFEFIKSIDELENGNPAEWQGKRLIIKGVIVAPYPKKIIETFDIS